MPTFQIEQDGRRFKVQASSMQDATEALKSHLETSKPAPGMGESIARGAMQGATANFSDELFALSKAGGGGIDDPRMGIDHLIGGAVKYFTGNKDAKAAYDTEVAKERERNKQASEEHPIAYTASEVGGAMSVPAGVGAAAATLPARMAAGAAAGGGFGALSGAGQGEGAAESLDKAMTGGGLGVLSGGAAPVLMRGVEAAAPYAAKAIEPIKNAVRGYSEPEAEAARRVVSSIARDYKNHDPGLSGKELVAARSAGQPVAVMDMGGETTRALARSAANTSPEGRAILNRTIDDRFEEQSPRLAAWLRSTFHYPNADAQQTALDNIARTVNRPNYAKAYADGANLKFTETLEQISQAPVVQEAIRRAMASAKNEAAKLGFTPPKTPFRFDETGRLKLKVNEDGSKMEPNLQFWDHVKRALDKTGTPEAKDWARILREHLDDVVPSYGTARAGAAKFFGAGDALEAGENFVGASQRFGIPEARKALAKMSAEERQLFQDGYISRLVQTIEKTGDRRNVVNQIMGSPAAREEMHVAIGAQRTKELEARLRVESIMDRMRGAVQGNSTTARQLAEAGLAGGITGGAGYGIATGDWNPKDVGVATVLGSMLSSGGRYAGAKVQSGIDQRVAKKVAEMLVSDDPKVLQKGLAIVAKQQKLLGALRTADDALARAGGNQLSGMSVPQLPGIGPSRADEQPERPRGQ
ncbi:hypothetical protein ACKWRH_21640 [Bradyrhizobium sp. Pa8]|uniref:hypothetical protein n=1 Tax=Bradyrhizobium sp. Pa8 TaxID=3386552 RepID=UPI00403F5B8D